MPRKNPLTAPLGKIKDTALDALKHPKDTAGKVVGQAKGTVALGRTVAEGVAGQVAGQVASRVPGRRAADAPRAEAPHAPSPVRPVPSEPPSRPHGDPVATQAGPDVVPGPEDEAAARQATPIDVAKKTSKKAPTKTAKKAPASKAPAKATAKKTPAKKAPAKKAPAKKSSPGDRLPPRRTTEDAAPLIDPSDTKQVAAEAERGRRDAEGPAET